MAATVRPITLGRYSDSVDAKDDEVTLLDNKKIYLGTGNDLEIYHDGTHSYIEDSGTGYLITQTSGLRINNAAGTEGMIHADENGSVWLYYDNAKKLETISTGIRVLGSEGTAGEVFIYADEGDDDADKWLLEANTTGDFLLKNRAGGSWETNVKTTGGGAVELYYDNVKKFETHTSGTIVSGDVQSLIDYWVYSSEGDAAGTVRAGFKLDGTNNWIRAYTDGTERLRIADNGDIEVSDACGAGLSGRFAVQHAGTNPPAGVFFSTGASYQGTTVQSLASRNTTNSSYNHFKCSINGIADKLLIRDSGNVQNSNNSYGATSDVNLKENIVDASSQWNDIKNIKVRKFNFKDNPTEKMLGVVAQEAELVCPNLVETSKSLQNGEEKDYKTFKYSILYMKAIKALQEAMVKIETLETKVAALEAG